MTLPQHRRGDRDLERHRLRPVVGRFATNRLDYINRFGGRSAGGATVNVREVPGYRLELTPFGGIKDSGLG